MDKLQLPNCLCCNDIETFLLRAGDGLTEGDQIMATKKRLQAFSSGGALLRMAIRRLNRQGNLNAAWPAFQDLILAALNRLTFLTFPVDSSSIRGGATSSP